MTWLWFVYWSLLSLQLCSQALSRQGAREINPGNKDWLSILTWRVPLLRYITMVASVRNQMSTKGIFVAFLSRSSFVSPPWNHPSRYKLIAKLLGFGRSMKQIISGLIFRKDWTKRFGLEDFHHSNICSFSLVMFSSSGHHKRHGTSRT